MPMIRAALPSQCPVCDAKIAWRRPPAEPFCCPSCRAGLRIRPAYNRTLSAAALVLAMLGVHALEVSGDDQIAAVLVGIVPLYLLLRFVTVRLFPEELEPTGDIRAQLHPVAPGLKPPVEREPIDDDATSGERGGETRHAPAPRLLLPRLPTTFEGAMLAVAAVVLGGYLLWELVEDTLYRARPEISWTRHAPRGFDLRAELRHRGVAFTNLSDTPWSCVMVIGDPRGAGYRAVVELAPRATREVRYAEFGSPLANADPARLRLIARGALHAECAGRSGPTHSGRLQ